ncbi:MAG TPA: helix-turn-helix transcriptional regulator [Pseudomonadales bacterium]
MRSTDNQAIAGRLDEALARRRIRPGELARQASVSAATVSNWLKGRNLNFSTLQFFCSQLRISLDWLVFGNGCMEITSSELTENEHLFVHTLRHADQALAVPLEHILRSVLAFHRSPHTLAGHPGKNRMFSSGQAINLIVNRSGDIVQSHPQFNRLLGLDDDKPLPNAFQLIAPDFITRARQSYARLHRSGRPDYIYLELLHQQNRQRLAVLVSGTLITHNNEIMNSSVIKPLAKPVGKHD